MEIFGWGPEKMVFTFSMEKHLSITRNIRIRLKQHNKKSNEPQTKVLLQCTCSIVGAVQQSTAANNNWRNKKKCN
jgi:hypothetical protein